MIPDNWLPPAKPERVIGHWSAGTYTPNSVDKSHYHILIDGDGKLVKGKPSIAANGPPRKAGYAAHTLNTNTGSIGVSIASMQGAIEAPFKAGKYPIKRVQWDAFVKTLAQLCHHYKIPVTKKTVLTHAEVQGTLGIKQKNKWDIAILPFDPTFNTAGKVGAKLRYEVQEQLNILRGVADPETAPVIPADNVDRPAWGVNLFRNLGWPRNAAIVLIGNFQQEAFMDLRTEAKGDKHLPGGSIGLGQWNNGSKGQFRRRTEFEDFCKKLGKSTTDFEANIRFADYELRTSEKTWGKLLMENSPTIYTACKWGISYLRPQGWSALYPQGGHGWSNRLNNSVALDKRLPQ